MPLKFCMSNCEFRHSQPDGGMILQRHGYGEKTLERTKDHKMLTRTQDFPMIILAGSISFLTTMAAFTAMTAPAQADEAPLPGFSDPYGKTPILGYTPGASHIRLANMRDEGTVTNYITIYGLDEKQVIGTVQVDVPAKASVGIQPHLMLETFAPVNWRQPVVMYVENGREKQLWQHLKYDERTGDLEDASVCTNSPHQDYIPARQVVLNAAVNRVGYLSSSITVHNFSDRDGVFEARMYDAGTGAYLGKTDVTLAARASFTQTGLGYYDSSDIVYIQAPEAPASMNIEFVPKAPDAGARLAVSHRVVDYTDGDSVNLSNPCAIHGGMIVIPPLPAPQ